MSEGIPLLDAASLNYLFAQVCPRKQLLLLLLYFMDMFSAAKQIFWSPLT